MSEKVTFGINKEENFSDWFTEVIKRTELADLRYGVKGFLVFQPWSVLAMESMYDFFEKELQKTGHSPYWYPSLIPEKNFHLEEEHVEGFTPEVFWVTEHGAGEKFEEKLALRPTSETAFYQMFALWIRSYNDLPFKTYQRAQVWRHETKATRPFLRSREFHWIEAHNAFASLEDAKAQVKEDMQITEKVMHGIFGVPFIFFQRPEWDKFPGAMHTFGADAFTPDGRTLQLPSTHLIGQNFSKAFNVKFKNSKGVEEIAFLTCFGPCMSRIFAGVIATHGDEKGLVFPFEIAPKQILIVPIAFNKGKNVLKKAEELRDLLLGEGYRVELDARDLMPGEKFYYWEMKGVPIRIELGPKELKEKKLTVFRRDSGKKETVKEKELLSILEKTGKSITSNLKKKADEKFAKVIKDVNSKDDLKKLLDGKKHIARVNFCSIDLDGEACAEEIEKEFAARIRGIRADKKETPKGNCLICKKKANVVAYIAREY